MKNTDLDHLNCARAQTISVVSEHWTLPVIRDVFKGLHQFSDIQNDLGIARSIFRLTQAASTEWYSRRGAGNEWVLQVPSR